MDRIIQFNVNIAMESVICLFLVFLFITCIWQKKTFFTASSFNCLLNFMILLLVNQIVTWIFLLNDVSVKYGAMPMRIVYFLDFILYYGLSIAFYYYIEALIRDGYMRVEAIYTPNKNIRTAILSWGVVISIIYLICLFIPSIYHIENGEPVYSIVAYVCMHLIINFACVCALVLIIRYRKIIGKHDTILCFIFCIVVSVFSIVDELCGLCISYVLVSLFIFILYVRIDLHRELTLERQNKEIALWKTEIMLSQMQPHFLYNVLSTISSLCEIQNAFEARDVVNRFADYFRTNLDSLGSEKMISFEKELEHVKTYLWLEKIRFEDSLNINYEINVTDFYLPSLTIQPMVENAVKHGIQPKEEAGTVTVKTYETDKSYVVEVEDDGVGFDKYEIQNDNSTHIGIENVTKRLEVICNGTCEIHSVLGSGTIVTISIPKGAKL